MTLRYGELVVEASTKPRPTVSRGADADLQSASILYTHHVNRPSGPLTFDAGVWAVDAGAALQLPKSSRLAKSNWLPPAWDVPMYVKKNLVTSEAIHGLVNFTGASFGGRPS